MRVDFSQETESGPVHFSGKLSKDEVTFLCEYALTDLIKKGLVPIAVNRDPDSIVKYMPGSKESN